MSEASNRHERVRYVAFGVLAFLFVAAAFRQPFSFPDIYDYNYFTPWLETGRRSILWYGDFPLWNPWTCGGQVFLANPQSTIASPTFLLILAFGTALGEKLTLVAYYFFALDGMYRLARHHEISFEGSIVAALVFAGCGWFGLHLAVGHINFATGALFPYLLLCHRRAISEPEWAIVLGALMAWIVGMGGTTTPALAIVLLALSAIIETIRRRSLAAITPLVFAVVATLIVGAFRLLPVLEFARAHPRPMNENDGQPLWAIVRDAVQWRGLGNQPGQRYGFHEYGWKLPYLALPLLLFGIVLAKKRWDAWVLVLVGILIAVGTALPFGPWTWLKQLPMYRDLRVPTRYLIITAIGCALVVGAALDRLLAKDKERRIAFMVIVAVIAIDVVAYNSWLFANTFLRRRAVAEAGTKFFQVQGHWSKMFDENLANHGVIGCDEEAPLQRAKELDVGDVPQARLEDPSAGAVVVTAWSPNHIALTVENTAETNVLVNTNWNEHWRAHESDGSAVAIVKYGEKHQRDRDGGRLALHVAPGRHALVAEYRPRTFVAGLWTTLLGTPLLVAAFVAMRFRRRRKSV